MYYNVALIVHLKARGGKRVHVKARGGKRVHGKARGGERVHVRVGAAVCGRCVPSSTDMAHTRCHTQH